MQLHPCQPVEDRPAVLNVAVRFVAPRYDGIDLLDVRAEVSIARSRAYRRK